VARWPTWASGGTLQPARKEMAENISPLPSVQARTIARVLVGSADEHAAKAVRDGYGALPHGDRAVVDLSLLQGRSAQDTARLLGCSPQAVSRARCRALGALGGRAGAAADGLRDEPEASLGPEDGAALRGAGVARLSQVLWVDELRALAGMCAGLPEAQVLRIATALGRTRRERVSELRGALRGKDS